MPAIKTKAKRDLAPPILPKGTPPTTRPATKKTAPKAGSKPVGRTPPGAKTAGRVIPIKPLTSWSFSRYGDYKMCPRKFKHKHIDKIAEPPNEAMSRGNDIHTICERFIKGLIPAKPMPPEIASLAEEFTKLRKMFAQKTRGPMIVEDQWAFKIDWSDTVWNDWAGCWLRIKLDCSHHEVEEGFRYMYVTDWKSGKFNDFKKVEYDEQLELYALAALLKDDTRDLLVYPRIGWLDEGFFTYPMDGEEYVVYTRGDIPALKKAWENRVRAMFTDTRFAPKPNNGCKWCFYGQSGKQKGGPGVCEY